MSKSPSALTFSESLRLFRAYLCGHHWELGEGIAAGIHEKDTESLNALDSCPALDTSDQTPSHTRFCGGLGLPFIDHSWRHFTLKAASACDIHTVRAF